LFSLVASHGGQRLKIADGSQICSAILNTRTLEPPLPGLFAWLLRAARIIGLGDRPNKRQPNPYRAFVIGPDGLAIAMHSIVAGYDDEALEKATRLQGELRIELWCGTRKVADVPAA
jgi:hypothetical protein